MEASLSAQQASTASKANGTKLVATELYQHDPLMVLLKDKLRLNDIVSVMGVAVLAGVVLFGLAFLAGMRFDLQGNSLGDTLRALAQTVVLIPLLFGIYLMLPGYIENMLNTLQENGVIGGPKHGSESYQDFLKNLAAWTDNLWWGVAA